MTQLERMSRMLAAIDADGRRYLLAVLQGEYDRVQASRRPALRLVKSSPDAALRLSMPASKEGSRHE
ncbi:MAG: hypothetical protein M3Y65_10550 [Pseudomonadota bacterium]|nr:hypothetical protein [Pseudomonadota bacterium]